MSKHVGRLATFLALALAAAPVAAQEGRAPDGGDRAASPPAWPVQATPVQDGPEDGDTLRDGMDLMGRGAELFLRGLMDQIGPELERLGPELRGLAEGMGPMITELVNLIDEIDNYHPPERLPNGDIILRRKDPSEVERPPLDPPGEGEIDI